MENLVDGKATQIWSDPAVELSEMELAMVGGGQGDISLG
jgi:hypothetical protein